MRIIKFFKHSLFPNRDNLYQPYLIRMPALAFAMACLVMLQLPFVINFYRPQVLGVARSVTEQEILKLTNNERLTAGQPALKPNPKLEAAAMAKAKDMLARDYWSHFAPDGTSPWKFIEETKYTYAFAGENLAKNFKTSEGVVAGWMNSSQHKDNLLSSRYSEAGIAVLNGTLDGEPTTLVVALYAAPRSALAANTQNFEILPPEMTYHMLNPLSPLATLHLATQISLLLLLFLAVIYVSQHLVILRRHLIWDSHVHPHPAFKAGLLVFAVFTVIISSFGAVG